MHGALVLIALISLSEGWQYTSPAPGELRISNRLPDTLPPDPHLVFRGYAGEFSVLVADRQIYDFRDDAARGRLRLHIVALPRDSAGQPIHVRIPRPHGPPYFSAPEVVAREELPSTLKETLTGPLREDIGNILLGVVLLVAGLISVGASSLLRRSGTRPLFWFGAMAALYGLRLALDSYLPYLLGAQGRQAAFAVSIITYAINVPGWALARSLIGDGWKGSLRWQLYAFIVFAPIAIASDLITGRPNSLNDVNNVLVILGGLNALINLIAARRQSTEARVILWGSVVFLAFAVLNNLAALGVLPRDVEVDESFGFVVFVAALGFAATRSVLRAERERVALDGELATAREIQRSILPRAMPAMQGLRFHAHYDPASSVAGDLYDFLVLDDTHAGVLVADVSGHGVPAALIASMVKIAVSSQTRLAAQPAAMLAELNRTLRREVRRGFVTATYLYFDATRRCVEIANAGHPLPLLVRDGTVRELGPHGTLLGRFDAQYTAETIDLHPGDRIVAYTDGVIEARNARGEELGLERLQELVRGGGPAEAMATAIAAGVRAWRAGAGWEGDDVTVVVVEVG